MNDILKNLDVGMKQARAKKLIRDLETLERCGFGDFIVDEIDAGIIQRDIIIRLLRKLVEEKK
jgi:hypothetical protein